MMKLLIVDDEQIEREGLQAILQRAFPELVIKQAKNGTQALEIVEEFHPDLILMDIKMPGLNGLETIERISSTYPAIKFVMITAYDSFNYARQAIKLGVKDFLLKPSKANEIVATVAKVIKQCEEEKLVMAREKIQQAALHKTLQLVETDIVTQLLFDHVHEVHLDMLVEMLGSETSDEKFVIVVFLPPGSEKYYSLIKEKVRITKRCWVGALYGRQLPLIVFRDKEKSFRSQAISLAIEIRSVAKKEENDNWFIGIGNVCYSMDGIRQSYQESLLATTDTAIPSKYRFYQDLRPSNMSGVHKTKQKGLYDNIRLGKWEDVFLYILNVIQHYENKNVPLLEIQQRVLELLWDASRIISEMGVEMDTPLFSFHVNNGRELRAETSLLVSRMKEAYSNYRDHQEADTIHSIKKYIIEHSHEDISLDMLGKNVGLSPIYISKLFKERLGINYIDFLTECRIEKAKKLMTDTEKSIKEITFEVGYHEPNYFSRVFKKMVGTSPMEYKKSLLSKR
ncbi:response regulator [Bacillus suaedaesalsae]|uniref:Response regulator n=1 Tax=Bacillus suaedaesalsae TaxID=2810349 RepID=A0ABS2DCJ9_9BACI|nr:response regulator [Bacillus suaedaesalsae]MBM6616177.1 response regulator [Bacillus suaedaesalsae]